MKKRIHSPDIECDSCVKVIDRAFKKLQGIQSFKVKDNYVDVEFDESLIKIESIMEAIKERGLKKN